MAKAVKLSDIAAIVGVSTVTVSKALSNQKGVSEEVRNKIQKLADEMGYRQPSAIRKSTILQNYSIGVLISNRFLNQYDSFYWMIYQAITSLNSQKGGLTLLEVVSESDEKERKIPKIILDKRVDGVIILGGMQEKYMQSLKREGKLPYIYLDAYDDSRIVDCILPNNFYGAYLLTDYLIKKGHHKIGYVGTIMATKSITDRYLGYQKALLENQIDFQAEWLIEDRDRNSGLIDMEHCFMLPNDMPTAFVCNCDVTAGYMVKKLNAAGYQVPKDISIVGFDNFIYPGMCDIEITTYEADRETMVKRAVECMIEKIISPTKHFGMQIIDGHLIEKESVKNIRKL